MPIHSSNITDIAVLKHPKMALGNLQTLSDPFLGQEEIYTRG